MAKSAPNFNPTQAAQNWVAGMGAAANKASAGADRVQTAPGELAAAQAQKFVNGVVQSVQDGVWQRRVSGVTLEEWRTAFKTKGVPRLASGAQAAQQKFGSRLSEVFAYASNLHQSIRQMPSDTPQARDQRMLAWANGMRNFKKQG